MRHIYKVAFQTMTTLYKHVLFLDEKHKGRHQRGNQGKETEELKLVGGCGGRISGSGRSGGGGRRRCIRRHGGDLDLHPLLAMA